VKLDGIDIEQTLKEAELLLNQEKDLSPALKAMFSVLILVVQLLTKRLELNSQNTSKPPSTDPNRRKK
jgi:transposase